MGQLGQKELIITEWVNKIKPQIFWPDIFGNHRICLSGSFHQELSPNDFHLDDVTVMLETSQINGFDGKNYFSSFSSKNDFEVV